MRERADLQAMLVNSWPNFTAELGEELLLIGQEVAPSDSVADRIDLLALDDSGSLVVIELKRGTHRLQLLQAIAYAGMLMRWSMDRIVQTLARTERTDTSVAEDRIEEFLGGDLAGINRRQRVLLLAEGFDAAVLAAAEWLGERHGVDLRCHRLSLFSDAGASYLAIVQTYPPPPAMGMAREGGGARFADWEAVLSNVQNQALIAFVRSEIGKPGRRDRPAHAAIRLWRDGRRLFSVQVRREFARVAQIGRFDGDLEFWRTRLSEPDRVVQINGGANLAFRLRLSSDFDGFSRAFDGDLAEVPFRFGGGRLADVDDDADDDEGTIAPKDS